jgi:hypothetical protein
MNTVFKLGMLPPCEALSSLFTASGYDAEGKINVFAQVWYLQG